MLKPDLPRCVLRLVWMFAAVCTGSASSASADCVVRENFGNLAGLDVTRADHHPNDTSCFEAGDTRFYTFYQFNAAAGREITITLTTSGFGPYLVLENASTLQIVGYRLQSQPGTVILAGTIPSSGDYWVVISSYEDYGGGDYTLRVVNDILVTPTPTRTATPASCSRCTATPTPRRGRPTPNPAFSPVPTTTRQPGSTTPVARMEVITLFDHHPPSGTRPPIPVRGRRTPTPTP